MNKAFFIIIIIISFFISCNDSYESTDCEYPDYSNCKTFKPCYGQLIIELTINTENPKVPIAIYKGKIENNSLFFEDTVTSASYSTTVDIDYYYSVKATYRSGTKTIIAIDGDDVKSKSYINCDSTCWNVQNGSIDVRLKY